MITNALNFDGLMNFIGLITKLYHPSQGCYSNPYPMFYYSHITKCPT